MLQSVLTNMFKVRPMKTLLRSYRVFLLSLTASIIFQGRSKDVAECEGGII